MPQFYSVQLSFKKTIRSLKVLVTAKNNSKKEQKIGNETVYIFGKLLFIF